MKHPRIRKFFSYYRPYTWRILSVLACALISAAAALLFPLAARATILQFSADNLDELGRAACFLLLFILIEFACSFYFDYAGHALGAHMENDMRKELFGHLQTLSFSYYDTHPVGGMMSALTHDLLNLAELYHHGPEDYIVNGLRFLGASVILFCLNPPLTLLLYCFIPPMLIITILCSRRIRRVSAQNQKNISTVNEQAEDALAGIRTIQAYCAEPQTQQRFSAKANLFLKSRKKVYLEETYPTQALLLLSRLMFVATLLAGSVAIAHEHLHTADLLAFLLYLNYLTEPIQKLAWMTEQLQAGLAGFDRFMDILETPPEIQDQPNAMVLSSAQGAIRFEQVSFRYHPQEADILHQLSFEIRPGQTVAFTGPSGIGKTTVCALISRFYQPQEGRILLDGHDISQLTLSSLRAQIAVVRQDTYLFDGTIAENIRIGNPHASDAEVYTAARKANAEAFIHNLPQGYETPVGPKGIRLSGGQRQRIEIARAFLKDAPILILDEATSSLDYRSEQEVQQTLESLRNGRTTLIIAHRLPAIRHADHIFVLDEQGIAEQGDHHTLLEKNGLYAALYRLQS